MKKDKGLNRSRSREIALQTLFATSVGSTQWMDNFSHFTEDAPLVQEYALQLIKGIILNKVKLDKNIKPYLKNWSLERVSNTELVILEIALFEMFLSTTEIKEAIIVDEAVELAKKYGDKNSGSFINGILRNIVREKQKGFILKD